MTALPSARADLIAELKTMILKECDLERDAASIPDDMVLVGEGLELDSLDALQISLAVKEKYGVRIEGGPDARRAFSSTAALADFIIAGKNAGA